MGLAIGLSEGGSRLPRFVKGKTISKYIGPELREKIENPIVFQSFNMGPNDRAGVKTYGYDVTILIDKCLTLQPPCLF